MINVKSETFFEVPIYFVRGHDLVLRIGSNDLPTKILNSLIERNGIIIWEVQGTFRLVPAPILCNILLNYHASQQLKKEYPRTKGLDGFTTIVWDQGISIPSAAVEILLLAARDHSDEFSKADTPANPTTKGQPDK